MDIYTPDIRYCLSQKDEEERGGEGKRGKERGVGREEREEEEREEKGGGGEEREEGDRGRKKRERRRRQGESQSRG